MIKVLFISGGFPNMLCGVGDYTFSLAQELASLDVDVHVLTTKDTQVNTDPRLLCNVQLHPIVPTWSLSDIPVIRSLIQKIGPDIIHIQYPSSFGIANRKLLGNFLGYVARSASQRKVHILTTLHEFSERRLRWRVRAVFNILSSDVVICVNRFDVDPVRRFRFSGQPVVYIPIASSIPYEQISAEYKKRVRNSIQLRDSDIILTYFGFITPLKGFEVLLEAMQILKSKHLIVKLLLISDLFTSNDEYHKNIVSMIKVRDLQDNFLLGTSHYSKKEVSQYLQCANMAVLPFVEGSSDRRSSLLAVLNQGIPTITTFGPHTPPNFIDGKNMVLIPPNNPSAIAQAVEILVCDNKLSSCLSEGAVQLSRKYSFDKIAEKTLLVYQNALG